MSATPAPPKNIVAIGRARRNEHYLQTEGRGGAHQGRPAGGNGERLMEWTPLYITTPADREAVALPGTPSDSGGGRTETGP